MSTPGKSSYVQVPANYVYYANLYFGTRNTIEYISKQSSFNACAKSCDAHPKDYNAFTWVSSETQDIVHCYLKWANHAQPVATTSGNIKCGITCRFENLERQEISFSESDDSTEFQEVGCCGVGLESM